jgi:ABC-type transporter Mla maintaining outer membrane lipid asymmetry permease subunit MlaE
MKGNFRIEAQTLHFVVRPRVVAAEVSTPILVGLSLEEPSV